MIFCWGGPDFKPQTDIADVPRYLVFNVFYFYSEVGRAHLPPPPFATPLTLSECQNCGG
jgi:hypothetical protein